MKKQLSLLALLLAVGLLWGCVPSSVPSDVIETMSAAPTDAPTPVPTDEPVQNCAAAYDAKKKHLSVTGTGDYDRLQLPDGADDAVTLAIWDDDFQLSTMVYGLPSDGAPLSEFLPAFLARTENSFLFLRSYLQENSDVFPADRAALPVVLKTSNLDYGYRILDDCIELTDTTDYFHREHLYLLALIGRRTVGWEQYGYAWYVGTCLDPYSEAPRSLNAAFQKSYVMEEPYAPILINKGIDVSDFTPQGVRAYYDAVARACFDVGLTGWGSTCESRPVTEEALYARTDAHGRQQDAQIGAFMAASLIGWLDDQYGFAAISAFCFRQKTFDEAFGTDFDTAFDAWKTWIVQTYPA